MKITKREFMSGLSAICSLQVVFPGFATAKELPPCNKSIDEGNWKGEYTFEGFGNHKSFFASVDCKFVNAFLSGASAQKVEKNDDFSMFKCYWLKGGNLNIDFILSQISIDPRLDWNVDYAKNEYFWTYQGKRHPGDVFNFIFSLDGKQIANSSGNKSLKIAWDVISDSSVLETRVLDPKGKLTGNKGDEFAKYTVSLKGLTILKKQTDKLYKANMSEYEKGRCIKKTDDEFEDEVFFPF